MVPTLNLVALFLDAIRKDYIHVVIPLLSTNPGLLDEAERAAEGNPLLITACEHGSLLVAEELGRRKPELVSAKDHSGYTAMHLASFKGCAREIRLLAELNPEVCLVEDNQFMIPLHIASMRGYDEAIKVLVDACPQSLRRLTPQHETALHLALKGEHWAAFQVLLQEVTKWQLEHLLNRQDHEGNTVLHISTSKMSIRAVKLLLPDNDPSPRVLSVNSMNKHGQTALDVYYQNPNYNVTPSEIQIGRILHEAGATEGRFWRTPKQQPEASRPALTQKCQQSFRRRLLPWPWQLETRNVILVVLVMIVGTAFTVICNLPRGLDEEKATKTTFYFIGVISGQLPTIFYLMLFNTVGVFSSILIIGILVWSLPLGAVLLLVVITTLIVYALIMDKILPKFDVKIGSSNISSSRFVWLSAVTFIFSGALVYTASKYVFWRIKSKSGTIDHIHMEQV
ncbi:hypothetical protein K2173_027509 [Erythroxylum novogranatense]|uniref:PGG domain-containing protein n=1 Tax=Erythroxylum novogranatense TaxID=1862640 RepID=A0AAV8TZ87_9ROSI|nr:hypothetical protein K2173_027509 [Erythroxylum novogranatense]